MYTLYIWGIKDNSSQCEGNICDKKNNYDDDKTIRRNVDKVRPLLLTSITLHFKSEKMKWFKFYVGFCGTGSKIKLTEGYRYNKYLNLG